MACLLLSGGFAVAKKAEGAARRSLSQIKHASWYQVHLGGGKDFIFSSFIGANLVGGNVAAPYSFTAYGVEACATLCAKRSDCSAYTYNSLEHVCYLKKKRGWTEQYKAGRISGYKNKMYM